jgi:hypothetical protein
MKKCKTSYSLYIFFNGAVKTTIENGRECQAKQTRGGIPTDGANPKDAADGKKEEGRRKVNA